MRQQKCSFGDVPNNFQYTQRVLYVYHFINEDQIDEER